MNKSKSLGAVSLIVIGFAAVIGYRLVDSQTAGDADISVESPTECRIGELVTLDAASSEFDSIVWNIDPETPNFKIINEGTQAIFSSEFPGDYVVTVATCKGKAVALAIVKLQVGYSFDVLPPGPVRPQFEVPPLPGGFEPNNKFGIDFKTGFSGTLPVGKSNIPLNNNVPQNNGNTQCCPQNDNNVAPRFNPVPVPNDTRTPNIRDWLPSNRAKMGKVIGNLRNIDGLIDSERFESKDEIVQAAVWSIKRATNDSDDWKPFIVNYSNYIEKATNKEDCKQKTKTILQSLENATT
jgi:hypothetical protein